MRQTNESDSHARFCAAHPLLRPDLRGARIPSSHGVHRCTGASPAIDAMTIAQGERRTLQHVSCPAANASTSDLHIISLTQKSSATLFCFPKRSNSSFFLSYRLV